MMAYLKELQKLINRTSRTSSVFQTANAALCNWCKAVYGVEPGDIDADEIIDAVQGGDGHSVGMAARRFDEIMRRGAL